MTRTDGKRLTKAQREVLRQTREAMSAGGMWFRRSSLAVAKRLQARGLLSGGRRHRFLPMCLFKITDSGRLALTEGKNDE